MNEGVPDMMIRKYQPSDCPRLAELFYQTVHEVNKQDYTKEQLNAWASGKVDLDAWNRSFLEHYTLIAVEEGEILGFGDIDKTGYLDHLYVHKDHQREGIASAINWRPMFQAISGPMLLSLPDLFFKREAIK